MDLVPTLPPTYLTLSSDPHRQIFFLFLPLLTASMSSTDRLAMEVFLPVRRLLSSASRCPSLNLRIGILSPGDNLLLPSKDLQAHFCSLLPIKPLRNTQTTRPAPRSVDNIGKNICSVIYAAYHGGVAL